MINLGFQQAACAFENKLQRVFIVPSLIKVLLGLKVEGITGMVLVRLHFVWGAAAGSLLRARKKIHFAHCFSCFFPCILVLSSHVLHAM